MRLRPENRVPVPTHWVEDIEKPGSAAIPPTLRPRYFPSWSPLPGEAAKAQFGEGGGPGPSHVGPEHVGERGRNRLADPRSLSLQGLPAEPRSWLRDRSVGRLGVTARAQRLKVRGIEGFTALVEWCAVVDVEPVARAAALALVVVPSFDLFAELLEPG